MKVGVETTVNTVSIVTIHALEKRLSQRPFEKNAVFFTTPTECVCYKSQSSLRQFIIHG